MLDKCEEIIRELLYGVPTDHQSYVNDVPPITQNIFTPLIPSPSKNGSDHCSSRCFILNLTSEIRV